MPAVESSGAFGTTGTGVAGAGTTHVGASVRGTASRSGAAIGGGAVRRGRLPAREGGFARRAGVAAFVLGWVSARLAFGTIATSAPPSVGARGREGVGRGSRTEGCSAAACRKAPRLG